MKIVCFGELMLRLAPNGHYRFFQNDQLQATFGGGEANAAVSLANYGVNSVFVTKLPSHAIGQGAVDSLRYFGVDTSHIVRGGERVGIYFLEKGASQRSSFCIYDRANSAIAKAAREEFDWETILENAQWFHFTGITPALGNNVFEICLDACRIAKQKGVRISFDPNYRSKLWTLSEASETIKKILPYVDLLIVNENQAQELFDISIPESERTGDDITDAGYQFLCESLSRRFSIPQIALTERRTYSTEVNRICGKFYQNGKLVSSRPYRLEIVDRVGGGDAFDAGLLYALTTEKTEQEIIEFATAASALKHTVEGDYNRVSVSEIENLIAGKGLARVQR